MNLVFAGPCGVGKSTIARIYSRQANLVYLDFDEIRRIHAQNTKVQKSPFSLTYLNLKEIFQNIAPIPNSTKFLLDIGGDTVFRKNVDNPSRLKQVRWIKGNYSSRIIVLTATKEALLKRYIKTKKRTENEFYREWSDWLNIAEPYWRKCGDIFIDTSFLSVAEVVNKINEIGVGSS